MGLYAFAGFGFFFYGLRSDDHNAEAAGMGLVYLAVAAIYYPILKRTFTFIEQARSACKFDDNEKLAGMFDSLRFVAKYAGIVTVVTFAVIVFAIIVLVIISMLHAVSLS